MNYCAFSVTMSAVSINSFGSSGIVVTLEATVNSAATSFPFLPLNFLLYFFRTFSFVMGASEALLVSFSSFLYFSFPCR